VAEERGLDIDMLPPRREVAVLVAEVRRLRADLAAEKLSYRNAMLAYQGEYDDCESESWQLRADLAAAQARVAAVETALREYGRHLSGCPRFLQGQGCECGWEQERRRLDLDG
jgi:hypothetical protein